MNVDANAFAPLLFLLMGLALIVRLGVFRGFFLGFWTGFFDRLFVGSRRPPGTASPLGCLVLMLLVLLFIGFMAWIWFSPGGLAH